MSDFGQLDKQALDRYLTREPEYPSVCEECSDENCDKTPENDKSCSNFKPFAVIRCPDCSSDNVKPNMSIDAGLNDFICFDCGGLFTKPSN